MRRTGQESTVCSKCSWHALKLRLLHPPCSSVSRRSPSLACGRRRVPCCLPRGMLALVCLVQGAEDDAGLLGRIRSVLPGRGHRGNGRGRGSGRRGAKALGIVYRKGQRGTGLPTPADHISIDEPGDNLVPPYAVRSSWSRPNSINTYASKPFPKRCEQRRLPANETRIRSSNGAPSGPCFQLPMRAPHERQPVRERRAATQLLPQPCDRLFDDCGLHRG